jgi:hypothetical protein
MLPRPLTRPWVVPAGLAALAAVVVATVGLAPRPAPPLAPPPSQPPPRVAAFRAAKTTVAPNGRPGVSRRRLVVGDPERSQLLLWSRDAAEQSGPPLDGPLALTPRDGGNAVTLTDVPFPAADPVPFAERAGAVPRNTKVGRYRLAVNGVDCGTVEVVKPPEKDRRFKPKTLPAGSSADDIEAALQLHDVELLPGRYEIERAIHLPPGRSITGYGAHLVRIPDGDYGERMFAGGQDCTVTGVTFHAVYLTFHAFPAATGLVLDRCTFASGIVGYGYEETVVRSCTFDGGTATYAPGGLYQACRFVGGRPASALMFSGAYPGNTAVVDCEFRATRDALVVQTNGGSFTDNLIHNLRAYNLAGAGNGNEICSAEGDPAFECSRNLYLGIWAIGCNSPLFWTSTQRRWEFVYGLDADGPTSICLAGWGGVEVTDCRFMNYELRGGRLLIGARNASGNLVSGQVLRNQFQGHHGPLIPSRMNQPTGDAAAYAATTAVLAYDRDECAANDLSGVAGVSVEVTVWKASVR